MSKSFLYTCIIPGCKFFDEPIAADRNQIIRHLRKDHNPQDLINISKSYGIIPPEQCYYNFEWLAHQITTLCILKN